MKRDVLFTRILFVKAIHTSKLLQSEMCRSLIDKTIRPIVKTCLWWPWLQVVSCVYQYMIYSCRDQLEVHRYLYFSVCVEQTLHFLQAFLVKTPYGHLGT